MDPAEAVRGFLDALEVPPQRIPVGLDAQAALYRSLLADRRDLGGAGQRPRPRAGPAAAARRLGCLVLVTSRNDLAGLPARPAAGGSRTRCGGGGPHLLRAATSRFPAVASGKHSAIS